jgi:hypothetical protein
MLVCVYDYQANTLFFLYQGKGMTQERLAFRAFFAHQYLVL